MDLKKLHFTFLFTIMLLLPSIDIYTNFIATRDQEYFSLNYLSDDFFYYAQIAHNLLNGKGLSFDGITQTNGFHPLWMLILIAISYLTTAKFYSFSLLVFLVSVLFSFFSFYTCYKLLKHKFFNSNFALEIAFLYFIYVYKFSTMGMEVTLLFPIVPLSLLFFIKTYDEYDGLNRFNITLIGLFSLLAVFSRLDIILYYIPTIIVLFIYMLRKERKIFFSSLILFALIFSPFLLYLIINKINFGYFVPLSGVAKGMMHDFVFSKSMVNSWFKYTIDIAKLPALTVVISILLMPFFIIKQKNIFSTLSLTLILLFPICFYTITGYRSDWPIWPWYLYPILFSFPISLFITEKTFPQQFISKNIIRLKVLVFLCLLFISTQNIGTSANAALYAHANKFLPYNSILEAAIKIKEFTDKNPGTYAMGDRAGAVGYLIDYPLIQLEGLVCDSKMIEFIRSKTPLEEIFQHYRINYYIATNPYFDDSTGWSVKEPVHAGINAPHIVSAVNLPAVYRYISNSGHTNVIFKVGKEEFSLLNKKIEFSSNNYESYNYLIQGWHPTESWGVWTSGKLAKLALPVPDTINHDLTLYIEGLAFAVPEQNLCQKITININSIKMAEDDVCTKDRFISKIHIPMNLLDSKPFILLTIEVSNPSSPYSLGLSDDGRKLGFGLCSIELL